MVSRPVEERAAEGAGVSVGPSRKFLIVRLSALGDTVCTLPAAAALKDAFPQCHITWVVDPRFQDIPRRCIYVDEVVTLKPSFRWNSWKFENEGYDVVFDLQGLLKSGLVASGVQAKLKLGYAWQREGAWLFTQAVAPDPTSLHVTDQFVDVVRAAGGVAGEAKFGLQPHQADLIKVEALLDGAGIQPNFVVFNPGSARPEKRYPIEQAARLCDKLWSEGFQVVVIGSPAQDEINRIEDLRNRSLFPPVSLAGQTSIGELVGLISLAKAHIGGDTGSTHIAAAMRIPCVGLYAATSPDRTGPYGQRHHCLYNENGLDQIAPEAVVEKLQEILE